jgi:hypothetical protein
MTRRGESGYRPSRKKRRHPHNPEAVHASVEQKLRDHIASVRAVVRKYDPLALLGRLFVQHCLCDPTTYEETTATHNDVWLEYVHRAFLATPPGNPRAMQKVPYPGRTLACPFRSSERLVLRFRVLR